MILVKFFVSEWAICSKKLSNLIIWSFIMSDLSELLTVALWHDCPEWLAHSRSFVLSNLSELLTVAHLIWAFWANEQMSDEWMSEFPTLPNMQTKQRKRLVICIKHPRDKMFHFHNFGLDKMTYCKYTKCPTDKMSYEGKY